MASKVVKLPAPKGKAGRARKAPKKNKGGRPTKFGEAGVPTTLNLPPSLKAFYAGLAARQAVPLTECLVRVLMTHAVKLGFRPKVQAQ